MAMRAAPTEPAERTKIGTGVPVRRALGLLDRAGDRLAGDRPGGWPIAALLTAGAWLAYALPWIAGGVVVPWDAKDFYYPVLRALAAALAAGDEGWWNPYLFAGQSAAADPQSWLMTPGYRLLAALDPAPSMRLADAVELLHLLAGAAGMLLLAGAMALRPLGGLVAALVFMLGGVAAARLQHCLMIVSYAHLPWALLLLQRSFAARRAGARLGASAAFGLVAGAMALGRDQVAFLNCLLLLGAAVFWLWRLAADRGPAAAVRQIAILAPGAAIGMAILAVPMLLTLDALSGSTRPEIGYPLAAYASLQPAAFLTLLAPNFFGSLDAEGYWGPGQWPWMELALPGYDWNDQATTYLYIGAVPAVAIALGLLRRLRPTPAGAAPVDPVAYAGLAFAFLYCIGAYTPAYRLFYAVVPGVDLFRRPNDAAFLLNAMLALVAAIGVDRLLAGGVRAAGSRGVALAVAVALALAGALWLAWRFEQLPTAGRGLAAGGLLLAAAAACWHRLVAAPARGRWVVLAAGFAIADLVLHHAGAAINARPATTIAAYRPDGAALAGEIARRLSADGGRHRAEIFGVGIEPGSDGGGSWQNAALAYGIEQTLGYDPLLRASYAAATGAEQNSHLPYRKFGTLFSGYDSPVARLLGIKLVVTGRPIETILPAEAIASLRPLGRHHGAFLYENADPLPRAMIVGHAVPDRGGALPADPRRTVLVAGLGAEAGTPDGAGGSATIRTYRRETITIDAEIATPGFLVLNDIHERGWGATVDGVPAPILRANRLFRAVAIPAGRHEVVFRYDPLALDSLLDAAARVLASD